ncbi:MAG TPA: hypothetical protein VNQ32_10395 [Steroidobacteraceae bacterium]|nr:hypothetical protein [Steroidobacteraceae bacterium]
MTCTPLLDECQPDGCTGLSRQQLAEQLRALDSTHIRGHHDHAGGVDVVAQPAGKHGQRREMCGRNAECIVESRRIVCIKRQYLRYAGRFNELGDVARGNRVPRLGAAILARERQIGKHGHHLAGAGIAQALAQEQQPQQALRR